MVLPRPGRRRAALPTLAILLPLILLLFTSTASAASAVLGIDLGTNFIKAAIVKPGTPLDIVLTKDSKRKEAAAVAFKPVRGAALELGSFPERLYGGDALALGGRFPADVYANLKALLGLSGDEGTTVLGDFSTRNPAIQVQTVPETGAVAFTSGAFNEKELAWSVEELLAMELKNIRANAEAFAGKSSGKITDAVITVPAFYTADERRAIERAADLAGLDVMALVSDGLAVGIDYAVKREFPNVSKGEKPETHLVFDMGAGSTTATVLRFQGKSVKDVGRFNKTVQEVAVLGTGWDRTLGGNTLNGLVLDNLVDEFLKKPEVSKAHIEAADVKSHGRTAAKLWREAERARQVLSANSDVRSSFEGLHNDIDFASKLSRTQYEELADSFIARIEGPVKQALEAAKLTMKDLDSIILHGGVVRTPFVQKRLEALAGKSTEVRSNVNSDESAAFGAAFKAAGLSPSFRVKEIRDSEAAVYAAGTTQTVDSKERQQQIFLPTSQAGGAKQITFKNQDDFAFSLYQKVDGQDQPIFSIHTNNLTSSVAALGTNFGCTKDDITTKFNIRLGPSNGLPQIVSGSVSCDVDGAAKAGSIGDSVKGLFGFGSKKSGQEALKEGDETLIDDVEPTISASSTSSTAAASASASQGKDKDIKPKKRTESINVSFTATPQGQAPPSPEEFQRMKDRLAAFDRSDKSRMAREEALNVLEAFTYRTRDLLTDVGFEGASTETVRSQLSTLLSSTSDWLSDEGAGAGFEILKSKLADLRALVDPIQRRREEAAARPEKLKLLQSALEQTKSLMEMVQEQVSKAASASSAAALEEAASSSSSAAASSTASTTTADDFADLEEPETSTSASTTAKPSKAMDFSPYTNEDLASLSQTYDSISSWLSSKTTEQGKRAAHEDAVISVSEIESKASELNKVMMDLVQKKMQVPKKSSSSSSSSKKAKATKSKAKGKGGKSSAPTSSGSETTAAASPASESGPDRSNFMTVDQDEQMPTEEEILEKLRKAQTVKRDEL